MKKIIVILSVALAFASCSLETPLQEEITKNEFNITITRADDTKAIKTAWEEGDVVFVFFSTVDSPKYLRMTYTSGAWVKTTYNGAGAADFTVTEAGKMTAIYLPYGSADGIYADGTQFKFDNIYMSYFLKAEKVPYTVSGGVVSGTLNMVAPEGFVQFAMPITDGTTKFFRETSNAYYLTESHITPCFVSSVAADGTISINKGSAGGAMTGYFYGTGTDRCINFSGLLDDGVKGVSTLYSFTFACQRGTSTPYDDAVYYLVGTKTLSEKSAIRFPYISSSSWKVPVPETVTIGGVKWAKWNVGATCEGGYGDYFSWGDPFPKANYNKVVNNLGENDLSSDYDVATQKLGASWHTPTKSEMASIINMTSGNWNTDNVSAVWISNPSTYGTVGWKLTVVGGSDYIFLPAAGYAPFGEYVSGPEGFYWMATHYGANAAYFLSFDTSRSYYVWSNEEIRMVGNVVRPVKN